MRFTTTAKTDFLNRLAGGLTVTEAAEVVGISERTIARHRTDDSQFAQAMDEALDGKAPLPTRGELRRRLAILSQGGSVRATELLLRDLDKAGDGDPELEELLGHD
jgi:predicted transcriptional regulator